MHGSPVFRQLPCRVRSPVLIGQCVAGHKHRKFASVQPRIVYRRLCWSPLKAGTGAPGDIQPPHWRGLNTLQSATTISVTALQSASTLLCNECATEQSMLPHTGMKPLSPAHNIQRLSHLLFLLGHGYVIGHMI